MKRSGAQGNTVEVQGKAVEASRTGCAARARRSHRQRPVHGMAIRGWHDFMAGHGKRFLAVQEIPDFKALARRLIRRLVRHVIRRFVRRLARRLILRLIRRLEI